RRRRGPRWFVWLLGCLLGALLLVLLVCALVGGLVAGIAIKLATEVTASATSTQTFSVRDAPSLDIHDASGQVRVQTGTPGVVEIEITKKARDASQSAAESDLDNIGVTATQTGDRISIATSFHDEGFLVSSSSVNLLITVPPDTNLAIQV